LVFNSLEKNFFNENSALEEKSTLPELASMFSEIPV